MLADLLPCLRLWLSHFCPAARYSARSRHPPGPGAGKDRPCPGRGAARGFAHIGVIKALEAQGIVPDIVVGTSAGSVVGALYSSGLSGFEMQKMALTWMLQIATVLPDRGVFKAKRYRTSSIARWEPPLGKTSAQLCRRRHGLEERRIRAFPQRQYRMAVRASSAVPACSSR